MSHKLFRFKFLAQFYTVSMQAGYGTNYLYRYNAIAKSLKTRLRLFTILAKIFFNSSHGTLFHAQDWGLDYSLTFKLQKHIFIFFFALVFALFFQNMQIYVNMKAIFLVMNTTWAVVKILSAVQIYDFHIFTVVYSPLYGLIWNQHDNQLPIGLLAQKVERCTGIAEVTGSNLVQAWIFFRPNFHYCSSSVYYCEDHFHSRLYPQFKYVTFIASQSFMQIYLVHKGKGIQCDISLFCK